MSSLADEPNKTGPHSFPGQNISVEEFMRVTRALRTLSAGNHTLLHATNEQELLHEMCRVIVDKGGFCTAAVGYAQHDEARSISWVASLGMEREFLETMHFTWADGEMGQSASGTAIRTGQPSVGRHILTDPVYASDGHAGLREQALKIGFASVSSFPLRVDGEVLGTMSITAAEPDAFDEQEVMLLAELADDLAYGISNLRVRSRHRQAEEMVERLAFHDPLTDLPNRTRLLEHLEQAIQSARDRHHSLALLHIEVGRFHELNKALGYRSGDELLQELAQRLGQTIRENETLARVGDSQFALLLPQATAEYATRIAQRIMTALHEPVAVAGLKVDARVTIGIALYPGHGAEPDALLRRASSATEQARPMRGGYAIYSGGKEQENTRRLALMGDLRHAIEHDQLQLYCQPKVNIAKRSICGAEALVRWPHPVHGMISPVEFIRLAEHAGLITPLTNWMLDASFSQSYIWHEAGMKRPLSINLSAQDLRDPRLLERIRGLFSTWGISPELIEFELTESALMEDPIGGLEALKHLKGFGTTLFIDDFGTGYSSLSYLQKLPVDALKIDQSFVMPMLNNHDSEVIVRSTIELGHNLELEVVAEGVENQLLWDRLALLGCDVAQGYLMSVPMPADQFRSWSEQWSKAPV
jgi:diguanylate cyclase (GGDEF)-like protein